MMYSGSDSTESQNYSQWALNPSTYQNMSNDQVDWAALAQQWIIMKEAGPPPVVTSQNITSNSKNKVKTDTLNEGGEAPMDVENEREENLTSNWNNVPAAQGTSDWTWNAQSQTWGWNNAWAPTGVPPPIPMKPPLLPTPSNYNQYNAPPESNSDNATFAGYTTGANSDYSSGYWTSAGSSKQIKPHNRRFSKVNVPRPAQPVIPETPPPLDAAKRKQLPAWIREGLEKMERDKLKQLEKEKEKQERDEYNEKLKQNEKETMEILKSTIKEQQRSKFESDGDGSDDNTPEKNPGHSPPVQLTPAEQMLNVRRTMTEILLKVTNREIETICREELQRYQKKHKASDHRVSAPSGANVTAKLGLGIYGGDSGSSSSSEESEDDHSPDRRDSDSELKDSIKRKKADFSKTEKEIEEKLAEAENRKQEITSRSPTPDTNDNDTQVDAKMQGGHKHRLNSTNYSKSSGRPARSRSSSSSSESASSYTESRKRSHRSSTSSSVSRDLKKSSKRTRSRSASRSRTPEKDRYKNSSSKSRSSKRSRSRSGSRERKNSLNSKTRYSRRSRSRSTSSSYRRRSRSKNRRSRSPNRRSRSPYARSRRSRSKDSRRRRSRSSSSYRGKKSRRR